jgi:hypothetical protein
MMPGLYNNETSLYEEASWMRDGTWATDKKGRLYIVCDATQGTAENEGPDGRRMDDLNKLLREGIAPARALKLLGLDVVDDVNKRFDVERGYYVYYGGSES